MSVEIKVLMGISRLSSLGDVRLWWQVFLICTDKQGPPGGPLRHVGTQVLQWEGWPSPSHHPLSLAVVKTCGLLVIWEILTPSLVLLFPPS